MVETINRLEVLLNSVLIFINQSPGSRLEEKPSPEKWSKKEILGHLVDSGLNNLQRFTEIQFEPKPYKIRKYRQDELVKANNYQNADPGEILNLLIAINTRIINVIREQADERLNYKIVLDKDHVADFRFLIQDYVDHFEHHVKQILDQTV